MTSLLENVDLAREVESVIHSEIPNCVHYLVTVMRRAQDGRLVYFADVSLADPYGNHSAKSKNASCSYEITPQQEAAIATEADARALLKSLTGMAVPTLRSFIAKDKLVDVAQSSDTPEFRIEEACAAG